MTFLTVFAWESSREFDAIEKLIAPPLIAVMTERIFKAKTLLTIMLFGRPLRVCGMRVNLRFHDMGVRSDP